MAGTIKSSYPGVRYRESKTRKHGIKPDRYFFIRYKLNYKDKEEGLGWASEGMKVAKASELLSIIKNNLRKGVYPQSLAEMREMAIASKLEQEKNAKRTAHQTITFEEFFISDYWPTSRLNKKESTVIEEEGFYRREIKKVLRNIPLRWLKRLL